MKTVLHAGRGQTRLETRVIELKLKALGVGMEPGSRQIQEAGDRIAGGERRLAAAAKDGVLDLDAVAHLPLTLWNSLVGQLRGGADASAHRTLISGALQTLTGLPVKIDECVQRVLAEDVDQKALRTEMTRLASRLVQAERDLSRVLQDGVLLHATPEQVEALSRAFEAIGARRASLDVLILSHGPAMRQAVESLRRHQELLLPHPDDPVFSVLSSDELGLCDRLDDLERQRICNVLGGLDAIDGQAAESLARMAVERSPIREPLAELVRSSTFVSLPALSQRRVTSMLGELEPIEVVVLVRLVTHPRFLEVDTDEIMLRLQSAKEAVHAMAAMHELVETPCFASLDPSTRAMLFSSIPLIDDPRERKAINDLVRVGPIPALTDDERRLLTRLLTGQYAHFSSSLRKAVGDRIETLEQLDPSTRVEALRELLVRQKHLPFHPPTTAGFSRKRTDVSLGPGRRCREPGVTDARVHDLSFDGRSIRIVLPTDPTQARGRLHSSEEILRAFECLDSTVRRQFSTIVVQSLGAPEDTYFARAFERPGANTYMTCGKYNAQVTLFPTEKPTSAEFLAASLTHEAAHALAFRHYGTDPMGSGWQAWRTAMAADPVVASGYARADIDEDFAEAFTLYAEVRGGPHENEVRALMPERFGLIDTLLSRDQDRFEDLQTRLELGLGKSSPSAIVRERLELAHALRPTEDYVVRLLEGPFESLDPEIQAHVSRLVRSLYDYAPRQVDELIALVQAPRFHDLSQQDQRRWLSVVASSTHMFEPEVASGMALERIQEEPTTAPLSVYRRLVFDSTQVPDNFPLIRPLDSTASFRHEMGGFLEVKEVATEWELAVGEDRLILRHPPSDSFTGRFRDDLFEAIATLPKTVRPFIKAVNFDWWYGGDGPRIDPPTKDTITVGRPYASEAVAAKGGWTFVSTLHRAAWWLFAQNIETPEVKEAWNEAQAADGVIAFSRTSFAGHQLPDLAAAAALYDAIRGRPEELTLRAAMPEQFVVLDQVFAQLDRPLGSGLIAGSRIVLVALSRVKTPVHEPRPPPPVRER